jgi:hypothetical protein
MDDPPPAGIRQHRRVGLVLGRLIEAEPLLLAKLFLQVDTRGHWASFLFEVLSTGEEAFTIATMAARSGSGSVGQAAMIVAKAGSISECDLNAPDSAPLFKTCAVSSKFS